MGGSKNSCRGGSTQLTNNLNVFLFCFLTEIFKGSIFSGDPSANTTCDFPGGYLCPLPSGSMFVLMGRKIIIILRESVCLFGPVFIQ